MASSHDLVLTTVPGGNALSPFRAAALLARLQRVVPGVTGVGARHVHLVASEAALDERDRRHRRAAPHLRPAVCRRPRRVRTSPPSSSPRGWARCRRGPRKATDIAHNCGVDVRRVERVTEYRLATDEPLTEEQWAAVADLLHDRMTETALPSLDATPPPCSTSARPSRWSASTCSAAGAPPIEDADARLRAGPVRRRGRLPRRGLHRAGPQPHRRRADDVRAGQLRALPAQDLQRRLRRRRRRAAALALRHDPAHRGGRRRGHRRRLQATTPRSWSAGGAVRWVPESADGPSRYAGREDEVHVLMKVETHNHPTAISPFPGAATGAGGEIRDEGATGRGSQPKAGLTGFAVSNLHLPGLDEPWEREPYGAPAHIASPLDIMVEGPIGAAAFNNEFGRPGPRRLLPRLRADRRRRPPRLPQADHERGRPRHDQRRQDREDPLPRGHPPRPDRWPGHADRHGWRRGVVDGGRRQRRRARLRLGAARQPRDRAPRAGGHQPLLGPRRRQPGPRHPRRRRRRAVQRLPRARRRRRPRRALRPLGRSARGVAGSRRRRRGATRARSATSWRSRRSRSRASPRCATASAARMPSSASRGTTGSSSSPTGPTTATTRTAPSTCRWRCCSASRRG